MDANSLNKKNLHYDFKVKLLGNADSFVTIMHFLSSQNHFSEIQKFTLLNIIYWTFSEEINNCFISMLSALGLIKKESFNIKFKASSFFSNFSWSFDFAGSLIFPQLYWSTKGLR